MGVKRHDADQGEAKNEEKSIHMVSLRLRIRGASDGAKRRKGSMRKPMPANKESVKIAALRETFRRGSR
jgi:hypothetical protein